MSLWKVFGEKGAVEPLSNVMTLSKMKNDTFKEEAENPYKWNRIIQSPLSFWESPLFCFSSIIFHVKSLYEKKTSYFLCNYIHIYLVFVLIQTDIDLIKTYRHLPRGAS